MHFIPAVDIKDGKCVRLYMGKMSSLKTYSVSPVLIAQELKFFNSGWIHVVDLDGAVLGCPCNVKAIKVLISNMDCNFQLGGGIRDMNTIDLYFNMGVNKVILGTSVLEDLDFVRNACLRYPGRIGLSIDTLDGMILTKGWTNNTKVNYNDIFCTLSDMNISFIVWTDVAHDGTMNGINVFELTQIIKLSRIPILVSGGISAVSDLIELHNSFNNVLAGVICGRALYERSISLEVAQYVLQS